MELSASVVYGIPFTQGAAEELINGLATYEAAQVIPELKDDLEDYFEVYEDEEGDPVEVSYPGEVLGRIAEFHPDYKGRLDYIEVGNTATVDDDDSVIIVFIASTFQEVEMFGSLKPLVEPAGEDMQLLHEFLSRFLTDVSEAPAPEWILAASGS